jgi:hypothetical protein
MFMGLLDPDPSLFDGTDPDLARIRLRIWILPSTRKILRNYDLCSLVLYRTSGVIFFHRLLHSYTRHIERVDRGERDIVPSAQD